MQQQQPNQSQNEQPVFQEPPQMITTKDFYYLTDMLSWNLLGFKKAHFAASQCQDQQIVTALEKACMMHERHYQRILQHLEQNGIQMNQ
ncbi:hypothetical protein C0971_02445 [Bacillus methanolicus]|uniref:hypothetical protein n=1 Tax=Bacillus methanolicus TaxID=1471 RepID=UPI0020100A7F|nr:hypothetical protein [Bacillus methanolicus]UQD51013.1 hypothetical protein C0971_02445 [Bacillus methanolicus]